MLTGAAEAAPDAGSNRRWLGLQVVTRFTTVFAVSMTASPTFLAPSAACFATSLATRLTRATGPRRLAERRRAVFFLAGAFLALLFLLAPALRAAVFLRGPPARLVFLATFFLRAPARLAVVFLAPPRFFAADFFAPPRFFALLRAPVFLAPPLVFERAARFRELFRAVDFFFVAMQSLLLGRGQPSK